MADEHRLMVSRGARYFTLGSPTSARDVWIVLHGYGQLADVFVRYFADLDDGTRYVVAPEALNHFYMVDPRRAPAPDRPVGATWMTRVGREQEIRDYVAYLDQLHDEVVRGSASVHVIGFSQGAATASRWAAMGRSRIDRLILWGGLTPPDLDVAAAAETLNASRLTIVVREEGSEERRVGKES